MFTPNRGITKSEKLRRLHSWKDLLLKIIVLTDSRPRGDHNLTLGLLLAAVRDECLELAEKPLSLDSNLLSPLPHSTLSPMVTLGNELQDTKRKDSPGMEGRQEEI